MARVTCCEGDGRLIERPQRADYDLDQLRVTEMHPTQKPCREADDKAGRGPWACTYGA